MSEVMKTQDKKREAKIEDNVTKKNEKYGEKRIQ